MNFAELKNGLRLNPWMLPLLGLVIAGAAMAVRFFSSLPPPAVQPAAAFLVEQPEGNARISPMGDMANCEAARERGISDRSLAEAAARCVQGKNLVKVGDDRWYAYDVLEGFSIVYGAFEAQRDCERYVHASAPKGRCRRFEPTTLP
jgi:hypothetical protein